MRARAGRRPCAVRDQADQPSLAHPRLRLGRSSGWICRRRFRVWSGPRPLCVRGRPHPRLSASGRVKTATFRRFESPRPTKVPTGIFFVGTFVASGSPHPRSPGSDDPCKLIAPLDRRELQAPCVHVVSLVPIRNPGRSCKMPPSLRGAKFARLHCRRQERAGGTPDARLSWDQE